MLPYFELHFKGQGWKAKEALLPIFPNPLLQQHNLLICQNYLSLAHICTSKGKEELRAHLPILPILLSQQHLLLTQKNPPLILVAPILS